MMTGSEKIVTIENVTAPFDGVIRALEKQKDAWNSGDIEHLLGMFKNDERLRYASGANIHCGIESVRKRFLETYPDKNALGILAYDQIELTPVSSKAALVLGRWKIQKVSDTTEGVFTLYFELDCDKWKILMDHTSQGSR